SNIGAGTINSGGASGFAMPVLRYYVGTGGEAQIDQFNAVDYQLSPADQTVVGQTQSILFTWPEVPNTKYYRLIVEAAGGAEVFSAVLLRDTRSYRAPSWLMRDSGSDVLRWRVVAMDANRARLSETPVRTLRRAAD
ncbi:MAG TPA: hypothetical protein VHP99_14125, partial [Pyrinomonadaceae bacterium]|nr:hypothetical protein [Pyrinomonadaceae bacterium]